MCNVNGSDGEMFSCACGLGSTEPKEPDSFVGALYEVSGKMLSSIPPTDGTDVLTVDGKHVRVAVLKSGDLQLVSLVTTDNKVKSIKCARDAHRHELKELQERLARLSDEKSKAEEAYSDALGSHDSEEDFDADDYLCSKEGVSLLKLVAQEKTIARRVKKLKDAKTLKVTFAIQGGMTASLAPGIVTAVPFVTTPMVWCPKSLAKAVPLDDAVDMVTVPIHGFELDTPSHILSEDMYEDLFRMLSPRDNASMTLQKLHDQTAGIEKYAFDLAVRQHANVVTVIQSSTGQVFGGFFVKAMDSICGWHNGHDDDFIFSLGNSKEHARESVKLLKPKRSTRGYAIHGGCGLHMGHSDLIAFCSHKTSIPWVYNIPADGYPSLPQGQSIAGSPGNYTPVKMEVYQVRTDSEEK